MKLAYLVSEYPAVSMAWLVREVLRLRLLDIDVAVASINGCSRPRERLTRAEQAEQDATYYVKPHGVAGALAGHWQAIRRNPSGYFGGWALAFRLAGFDLHRLMMNVFFLTEALMVAEWMRREGRRHLHVHLGQQGATVGVFVKRVFGLGFSMTVHGPDEFYDTFGQYLPQKIEAADFICCISQFARSQLMRLSDHPHWAKMHVARLGVDPAEFKPAHAPLPQSATFEILCVGRLTPSKGQHILIEAVAMLHAAGRSVVLRMVGDGPDRASLEAQAAALEIAAQVVFVGAVNQDAIRALYAQASCFCLPSFAEGVPVVLMEAMAMEIPCVTTRITGVPELIDHEVNGLLVAASDTVGLAAALTRLMDDPALRMSLGRAARVRVNEEYNLDRNVRGLAEVFRKHVA